MDNPIKLFSGTSHPALAAEISEHLGVKVSEMKISRFACGEIYAKSVNSVRGADVYIIQTATQNVNEDYMELFIMIDALKRSFAKSIHVVIPHFGYARQDRVASPREPITAKLIADLIQASGADHVIGMKFHSEQIQGFFDFPVDNLNPDKIFCDYFKKKNLKDLVVVSADAGGAKDAKKFADKLGANLAIIHKNRPNHNIAEVMHVVGNVKNKTCLIYDDMIDTAGSVFGAKQALERNEANPDIYLAATHAIFSGSAIQRLKEANFKEVVITNTIPVDKNAFPGLKILSVAPLMANIIRNVHEGKSITGVIQGEF
ncbi:ribose-phosphate pyrophosphokinase [Candidatus Peregrinibacteria bacterium RIFOXYB2_FULL_32_7]|nr:MAG: ribose-phosphate pyrophosphokinase [Candidatus Peregrinibacteria bacterium RIFOXYB2_FULL_32_7]